MGFKKEIEAHIAAGYPLLYVRTFEELRARIALREASKELGKKFFLWSSTIGLCEVVKEEELKKIDGTQTPEELATHLFEDFGVDDDAMSVVVLCDFHPFLQDPMVTRIIRELGLRFKEKGNNLILLSPVFKIPDELKKDVTLLEFDLPDKKELGKIISDVGEGNEVKIDAKTKEKVIEALSGLTSIEAENALALSIYNDDGTFNPISIMQTKAATIKKSGILEYYESDYTMNDVGGFPVLKNWLSLRGLAFTKDAHNYGIDVPKGSLLIGIPGCGKSLVAKSIANMWGFPLLKLDLGRVFGSLVGQSEENMREAINLAEAIAPCILFIDEIEKGLAGSSSSGKHDSGVTARVFGTILSWMQDKTAQVFVIATANNISALPPEFLRKGRFDEIFFVDLPNVRERKEIFGIHLKKKKRDPKDFEMEELVSATNGFTGSEIEEVVKSALFLSFSNNGRELRTNDILSAIRHTIPLSKTMSGDLEGIRRWAKDRAVNVSGRVEKIRHLKKKRVRKVTKN